MTTTSQATLWVLHRSSPTTSVRHTAFLRPSTTKASTHTTSTDSSSAQSEWICSTALTPMTRPRVSRAATSISLTMSHLISLSA